MTRAAQRLYISQPALSKLLASVESELGVQLFRQENRRMIPTAAGKIYLENAEKILSLNHDMERTVRLASSQSELTLAYPLIYSGFITGSVLPASAESTPRFRSHSPFGTKQNSGSHFAWTFSFRRRHCYRFHSAIRFVYQHRPAGNGFGRP